MPDDARATDEEPSRPAGNVPGWVGTLLACRFAPQRPFQHTPDGRVALQVPRFDGPILRRWLLPRLRHPDFSIALDELGSAAWDLCDDRRTGEEMAAVLSRRFGDAPDLRLRLAMFLRVLVAQGHLAARPGTKP